MAEYPALDRIDRAILDVLQRDGRLTNALLAEAVHLSPSACLTRVKRLEKSGIITGYKAQIDPSKIGPHIMIYAHCTLSKHNAPTSRRFEALIKEIPEVMEAFYTSGQLDYILRLIVSDISEWTNLAEELMDREDLHIDTIVTHVIMKTAKPYSGIPVLT